MTEWFSSKETVDSNVTNFASSLFNHARSFVAKSAEEKTLELDRKTTPNNLIEALSDTEYDQWKTALDKELTALSDRNCYTICSIKDQNNRGDKTIKSKLCFRIKVNPDRTFKYKVRLVACGYSQRYGIDYDITYSPTAQWKSLTTILHLAAIFDWELVGYDVQNAFVEGQLTEDIYMNLPTQLVTTDKHKPVKVKLNKSLYGLKQAGYIWNLKLVNDLKSINFIQSIHDKCVFIYTDHERNIKIYFVTFVDDILITGNCINTIHILADKLSTFVLKLTCQESITRYIGLEIARDRINHKIMLNQSAYI